MRFYDIAISGFSLGVIAAPFCILALTKKTWRRRAWMGLKAAIVLVVASLAVGIATSPPKEVLEAEAAARQSAIDQAEQDRLTKAEAANQEKARLAAAREEEQRLERDRQAERAKEAEEKRIIAEAEKRRADEAALAELRAPKPTVRDAIGCLSREANDKLSRIASSGDKEAFTKLATALVMANECKLLKAGTRIYLEDTAIFSGLICGRPAGSTACYWLPIEITK